MNVLVVGSGGREHALVWKIAQSPRARQIFVAPGNAGTARLARNINISPTDIKGLIYFALEAMIDLVVVGPEGPLAAGIVDAFQEENIPVFGPTKIAAEIESSKVFAKSLMEKYNLPGAKSASFSSFAEAKQYLLEQKLPVVIKADGLAAGKGVVVVKNTEEGLDALTGFMEKEMLGEAGKNVIIEEFLSGREMSAFVFTDGKSAVPLEPACDYKTIFEDGNGPNTGGMGSYSPPAFYNRNLAKTIQNNIMMPAVQAMESEHRLYKGLLYGGLMIDNETPRILEFNARFGDPETQVVLPRLKTDLVEIMLATINDKLDGIQIEWSKESCVGVVLTSGGYPGKYNTGLPITGLDKIDSDVLVFHAGTRLDKSRKVVTNGGRVLAVVATGKNIAEAREKVYNNIPLIQFEGCHYRKDIALIREE